MRLILKDDTLEIDNNNTQKTRLNFLKSRRGNLNDISTGFSLLFEDIS